MAVYPWYLENDNFIEHSPIDRDGNAVTGATVQVTFVDSLQNNTTLSGTTTQTLVENPAGTYAITLDKAFIPGLTFKQRFVGRVTVDDGAGGDAERIIHYLAVYRPA